MVTGAVMSHSQGFDMVVKVVEVESGSIKVAERLSGSNTGAIVRQMPAFAAQLANHFALRGLVIHEKGDLLIIDLGKNAGVMPGMEFEVFREGEPIKHPVTGEILGVEKTTTGLLQVTEVQQNLAFCKVMKQEADQVVSVGQRVVSKPMKMRRRFGGYGGSSGGDLRYARSWGAKGTGQGDFIMPYGITADGMGNILIADTHNNRIQVIDSSGLFRSSWGQKGTGPGSFMLPYDVATDSEGNVYVADTYNFRIQKFDPTGRYLLKWGQRGAGNGDFAFLSGIAVGPEDQVIACDAKLNRIQVFDNQGRYVRSWGQPGAGSGDLAVPMGITVDPQGQVYVADSKMRRVQKFDNEGRFLAVITGKMTYPVDVAVDPNTGNLWVLDGATGYFWEMSPTGQTLRTFGGPGAGNGQFVKPYGICVDDTGNVYVADTGNCRIQKFAR
jgi:DNA-binding beta-propeller fold protein YncE